MFTTKQIIWAKTKGYPWWPAQICKLPTPDHNYFKVSFLGQNNHAVLQPKAIRKYFDYYEDLKSKKFKGLTSSIELADSQMQKRKIFLNQKQKVNKPIISKPVQKIKKIKKKTKKKSKLKKIQSKNNQKQMNQLSAVPIQQQKKLQSDLNEGKQQPQSKQRLFLSQNQSVCLSNQQQGQSQSQIQINQLQYIRNVDRKKIQVNQQILVSYITRFNTNNYEKQRQCYEKILYMQKQDFKPQQLLQSKITNMLSYIEKKLNQRINCVLKKQQIQKIKNINIKFKSNVINYLFNCSYYDQYLKRMQKSITYIKQQQQKLKIIQNTPINNNIKHKKYKRKYLHKKTNNQK